MNVAKVDYKGRMNRQKKKVNEKAEGKGRRLRRNPNIKQRRR